jgi:alpha-beta hydrolase superfamily lysophospholipase
MGGNKLQSNFNILTQKDGYKTKLYHFQCKDEIKGSILIIHGMTEHHKRYIPFAKFLNDCGIDVYIYDHRGHGTDTSTKDLGYIHDQNGHNLLVNDAHFVIQYVNANKRSKKLILMGHSMGSLVLRNVIQEYDKVNGVIICGTTFPNKIETTSGLILSSLIQLRYGGKHLSPFFNNVLFGRKTYTNLIKQTDFDWLSRNSTEIDTYINDPYCGFICSISFYRGLLKLAYHASTKSRMKRTRKNLPMFIISGSKDPVGNYGKEVKRLISFYKKADYNNITYKLYKDCRHELLFELNSQEVMEDISNWMLKIFS